MRLKSRPLLRFALTVLALLPACFVLWNFLAAYVAAPAIIVAQASLQLWVPELIESVAQQGTVMLVTSQFGESGGQILRAEVAGNQLAYPINSRTLSYSIPFFIALYFSTPGRDRLENFSWCLLALWGLLAVGLIATAAKELLVSLGPVYIEHSATPSPDITALLYQFSVLMVPALAPVLLWAYTARTSPAFRALLPEPLRSPTHDG